MPTHAVREGECISSIAEEHGLRWQTVWEHPENAGLREKRADPNVLLPGDVLFVPERERRAESGATEQRHRFRARLNPTRLHLRLLQGGDPLANKAYVLSVEAHRLEGTTDAEGRLAVALDPRARQARLRVQNDAGEDLEYRLRLGGLDPVEEVSGLQDRLNNLGYHCGKVDGIPGPLTRAALKRFQADQTLEVTGDADAPTRNALVEQHGS